MLCSCYCSFSFSPVSVMGEKSMFWSATVVWYAGERRLSCLAFVSSQCDSDPLESMSTSLSLNVRLWIEVVDALRGEQKWHCCQSLKMD